MAKHSTAMGALRAVKEILDDVPNNIAKSVMKDAKEITPVKTGTLRDGFEIEKSSGLGDDALLKNDVPYSGFIEFGTENMQPRAMLGQAAVKVPQNGNKYLKGSN